MATKGLPTPSLSFCAIPWTVTYPILLILLLSAPQTVAATGLQPAVHDDCPTMYVHTSNRADSIINFPKPSHTFIKLKKRSHLVLKKIFKHFISTARTGKKRVNDVGPFTSLRHLIYTPSS
jgi:hypothetical protein